MITRPGPHLSLSLVISHGSHARFPSLLPARLHVAVLIPATAGHIPADSCRRGSASISFTESPPPRRSPALVRASSANPSLWLGSAAGVVPAPPRLLLLPFGGLDLHLEPQLDLPFRPPLFCGGLMVWCSADAAPGTARGLPRYDAVEGLASPSYVFLDVSLDYVHGHASG
nr:uncharacterized protein LOC127334574 [Lolium perenne]